MLKISFTDCYFLALYSRRVGGFQRPCLTECMNKLDAMCSFKNLFSYFLFLVPLRIFCKNFRWKQVLHPGFQRPLPLLKGPEAPSTREWIPNRIVKFTGTKKAPWFGWAVPYFGTTLCGGLSWILCSRNCCFNWRSYTEVCVFMLCFCSTFSEILVNSLPFIYMHVCIQI